MLQRYIENQVQDYLNGDSKKIFFIWGPRRSGKTTLLKDIASKLSVPVFNFDLISDQASYTANRDTLEKIAFAHKVILIDEVQNYPESTVALKILYDEFNIKVIATGSSELRQKSANFDTLAGRFTESYCLPLSLYEINENTHIEEYARQGFYNKIVNMLKMLFSL